MDTGGGCSSDFDQDRRRAVGGVAAGRLCLREIHAFRLCRGLRKMGQWSKSLTRSIRLIASNFVMFDRSPPISLRIAVIFLGLPASLASACESPPPTCPAGPVTCRGTNYDVGADGTGEFLLPDPVEEPFRRTRRTIRCFVLRIRGAMVDARASAGPDELVRGRSDRIVATVRAARGLGGPLILRGESASLRRPACPSLRTPNILKTWLDFNREAARHFSRAVASLLRNWGRVRTASRTGKAPHVADYAYLLTDRGGGGKSVTLRSADPEASSIQGGLELGLFRALDRRFSQWQGDAYRERDRHLCRLLDLHPAADLQWIDFA